LADILQHISIQSDNIQVIHISKFNKKCWWFVYTGCNRWNGPDFGRVFLRSYYTDI